MFDFIFLYFFVCCVLLLYSFCHIVLYIIATHSFIIILQHCMCAFVTLNKRLLTYLLTFLFMVQCGRVSWLTCQLLSALQIFIKYRILRLLSHWKVSFESRRRKSTFARNFPVRTANFESLSLSKVTFTRSNMFYFVQYSLSKVDILVRGHA